jgi:hypothetical protein
MDDQQALQLVPPSPLALSAVDDSLPPVVSSVPVPKKLTPQVQAKICSSIRHGQWDFVAAQAAGIRRETFYEWLRIARDTGAEPYFAFAEAVAEARAEARGDAEGRVYTDKPDVWLRIGPGQTRPGEPGWTQATKLELSGPGGRPLGEPRMDLSRLSTEELATLEALVAKASGPD